MRSILELPIVRDLHRQNLLLPAILLLAVAGVLIQGALNRQPPAEASEGPKLSLPSPPSLPNFRPDLEKTPLTYFSDYWQQLSSRAKGKIVLIGDGRFPGVVVAPGIALTSADAADDVLRKQAERRAALKTEAPEQNPAEPAEPASGEGLDESLETKSSRPAGPPAERYRLLGVDSELKLALFELARPFQAAAFTPVDPATLRPGMYLAAVSLNTAGEVWIAPGYLISPRVPSAAKAERDSFETSIVFPRSGRTAAIVDLDGSLLGVALPSGHGMRLLSSEAVLRIVDRLRDQQPCRAIDVATLSDPLLKLLGVSNGVVVEEVRKDAFVPAPSLRPGDVLLQWNRQPVVDATDFQRLYDAQEPGTLAPYVVLRNRKRVSGATRMPGPDCRPEGEPLEVFPKIGLTLQWGQTPGSGADGVIDGWKVLAVSEDSPAAEAAVERDDWIIAMDGVTLTTPDAKRPLEAFERKPRSLALTLWRNGRVKLLLVPPPKE